MSCNCNLKYTSWLSDLIPPDDSQILFNLDLKSLMEPFDPAYSGIWKPLILNEKRFQEKKWADTDLPPERYAELSELIGKEESIKINNPQFQNWLVEGDISVGVTVGMDLRVDPNYTVQGVPNTNSSRSDFASIQTTSIIRNKLNDEKITDESLLNLTGTIPRIDNQSSIVKTEVIRRGKIDGLEATDSELIGMFTANLGDRIDWTFNGNLEKFKYLSTSDVLILDYTIFTEKSIPGQAAPQTGQYSIRIALFGQNDLAPPAVISDTGSGTVYLSETSIPVTSGYITIRDEDLSQDIYAYVNNVTISGNTRGLRSSVDELKSMLVFTKGKLRDSIAKQKTVEWTFNAGSESFNYLAGGESLTLVYDLYIYDNLGKYTQYVKTITIVGKNEAPSVGVYSIDDRTGGIYNLNFPQNINGTLSYHDVDTSDSVSANVLSVGVKYSILGLVSGFHEQFKNMLTVSTQREKIRWEFQPDTTYLEYLGQGTIVELNYIIEVRDSEGAKAYGLVTILVVGKNEAVETNLSVDKVYELEPPVTSTKAIIEYDYFTISDNNTSDLINISILDYKYELTNVSKNVLPKNFDVSHMLFFLPNPNQQRKNSFSKVGNYIWVFNTYPQHFRFLNATNKSIKITYRVLVTDIAGSYQIKTLSFEIKGYEEPEEDSNNPGGSEGNSELIFGWYRYYDIGKIGDNRYIPGVDFYFGYLDTYLNDGYTSLSVDEYRNLTGTNSEALAIATIKLIQDNNSLKQYLNNKDRQKALDILSTSPYIDMLTHKLIDIDALDYERDEYGRILPLLKGMSSKKFKDATAGRFASTKQDIFYRLAQKYGLSLLVDEGQTVKFKSKFLSDVGANLSIKYGFHIEKDIDQTNKYIFVDQTVKVGDIKYSHQFAGKGDGEGAPIVINLDYLKNIPIISYIDNKLNEIKQGASFNIIEKRLNDIVFSNRIEKRDGRGDPNKKLIRSGPPTLTEEVVFNGHGGLRTPDFLGFVIGYEPKNTQTIEAPPSNIEITFHSNEGTRAFIGDFLIDYLRTPKRPYCEPFIIYPAPGSQPASYSPGTYIYDFSSDEYGIGTYVPSITNFYIPNGTYYANLTNQEKNKLGIDIYDHPNPKTPFLKTHDLKVLNPIDNASNVIRNTILELVKKGTYNIDTDISDLDSGYVCLEAITSSGIFNLEVGGKNISSTDDFTPGRFLMCLENIAKSTKNVKLAVDVADECDFSHVRLTHSPHQNFSNPFISKIEVPGSLGFFHPNSGWIRDPKYYFKSPMAPYCPAPLTIQQSGMVKDKKMRYDHYFWYDNEKMYNTDYADGFNFMFNMTSLSKTIIDNIQKSTFIGIKKDDYYLMTHEFYKFVYNIDESPIKQSVSMSYLDIDYSYGYPFNDFTFSVILPNIIMVNSNSNKERVFSYFDDALLRKEKIELFDSEILYIDNSILSTRTAIIGAQNSITTLTERIIYWQQQLALTKEINEINRINGIIQNLTFNITSIGQTITSLSALLAALIEKRKPFKTEIVRSYGDNESLILQIGESLPPYLLDGGYVRKDLEDPDRSRSYIIYKSNIARNDFQLKVNKWGHIINGKDLDEYNSSILRQKNWQQSSLFLNQDNNGRIVSSGYYFPFSYATNVYMSGNKKYEIRFRQANSILDEGFEKKDYGNISHIVNKIPANIYLGPYKGPVLITTAPKVQKGSIGNTTYYGKEVLSCYITDNRMYNLKGGDVVKFESIDPDEPLSKCCLKEDTSYYVIRPELSYDITSFIIGTSPKKPLPACNEPDCQVFVIANDPKFNYDTNCLGSLTVKQGNKIVGNKFFKEEKPIFAQIHHVSDQDQFYKYLPYFISPSTKRYVEAYNKFIGSIPGQYYSYVDDPLTKAENGFIKTNRYGLYNHTNNIKYNYYTSANGTSATPINKPISNVGSAEQGLLERYRQDNNDLIDSVVRSLYISIDTLNADRAVLNSFLTDTSKSQNEKLEYNNQILSLNNRIQSINQTIGYINGLRVNNPVIDDNNYKKLPLTYNLNVPSGYYKDHDSFLDINIFGIDPRTKPTIINGQPAVSGYVYFEGLVEPPLSDFYNNMQVPYDDNLWIDIPENANFSVMTKYGQVFNSQEEYSILLQKVIEGVSGVENISTCNEQFTDNIIGNIDNIDGGNEAQFFKTIGINNHKDIFDTKIINLPTDCGSIDLCCDTMIENDQTNDPIFYAMGSIYHDDYLMVKYPTPTGCIKMQDDIKKECSKDPPEIQISCINHKCPRSGGAYKYLNLIGTLKDDNFNNYNHGGYPFPNANGVTLYPKINESNLYPEVLYPGNFNTMSGPLGLDGIGGKIVEKSKKILLFKIKKINLKNIIPPSVNSLFFINDGGINTSLKGYPDSVFDSTYVGRDNLLNVLDTTRMVYPTQSAGIASYTIDPDYVSKNHNFYTKFSHINNPKQFLLRPNSNTIIWKNETSYRNFVSHPNKINGLLAEYDIMCYGNNNPYFVQEVVVNNIRTAGQNYKNIKELSVKEGELYELTITDNGKTYSIKAYIISCGAGLCYEFVMNLGGEDITIDYEMSISNAIRDTFVSDVGCQVGMDTIPNPPDPTKYKDIKPLYSFTERLAGSLCSKCPEHFFYCDDLYATWELREVEVQTEGKDPPWPVGSKVVDTGKEMVFEGSRETCIATDEGRAINSFFVYARHPDNYETFKQQFDCYIGYPINLKDSTTGDAPGAPEDCQCFVDSGSEIVMGVGNSLCKNTKDNTFAKNMPGLMIRVYHNIITISVLSNSYDFTKDLNNFYITRDGGSNWLLPKIKLKLLNKDISA